MIDFFFNFLDNAFMLIMVVAVIALGAICALGPAILALCYSPWWALLYFISIPFFATVMDFFN